MERARANAVHGSKKRRREQEREERQLQRQIEQAAAREAARKAAADSAKPNAANGSGALAAIAPAKERGKVKLGFKKRPGPTLGGFGKKAGGFGMKKAGAGGFGVKKVGGLSKARGGRLGGLQQRRSLPFGFGDDDADESGAGDGEGGAVSGPGHSAAHHVSRRRSRFGPAMAAIAGFDKA